MRPIDSAYDRNTSGMISPDPGPGDYALIIDGAPGSPCSVVEAYASLAEAIEDARGMDTDGGPIELELAIGYDAIDDRDGSGLIMAAEAAGWSIVASAPAGEYWTVMGPARGAQA